MVFLDLAGDLNHRILLARLWRSRGVVPILRVHAVAKNFGLDMAPGLAGETPLGQDVVVLTAFDGHEEMSRLFSYHLELLSDNNAVCHRANRRQERHFHCGVDRRRRRLFQHPSLHFHVDLHVHLRRVDVRVPDPSAPRSCLACEPRLLATMRNKGYP